ncbi:membrane-bound alpha-1,6- mannosyltransferase Initiation-specific [Physocladia obscura]|uniref:Membrane-bound alpha-1,6- mannosyltransferase Initiation-specific n=1 Tax=Physocladia obscura TaxID=109957 RepID=A0AAD5T1L0_9FUNG|nr:membrane-bound alpha-1,6- mannosyltransferase Initiation-specific [Physocladia obscura]
MNDFISSSKEDSVNYRRRLSKNVDVDGNDAKDKVKSNKPKLTFIRSAKGREASIKNNYTGDSRPAKHEHRDSNGKIINQASDSSFEIETIQIEHENTETFDLQDDLNFQIIKSVESIPKHIISHFKTNNRIEIKESAEIGTDHKDRWPWFESWDIKNQNYTHFLFDWDDSDRFVLGIFGHSVQLVYFALPLRFQRLQFLKYLFLYHFGGVYVDMDMSANMPIDSWSFGYSGVKIIIGVESIRNIRVKFSRHVLAACPHHPLILQIIVDVTEANLLAQNTTLKNLPYVVENIARLTILHYFKKDLNSLHFLKGEGRVKLGDTLFLGPYHFHSNTNVSLTIHHNDGFIKTAERAQKFYDFKPEATKKSEIYRPSMKHSVLNNGTTRIPYQILRSFSTNNRIEIQKMAANDKEEEDRWYWWTTWDKKNPRHIQILFNDDDTERFVRGAFTDEIVTAYFKLPRIVQRADFARYLMLYRLGGLYTDMDTSCAHGFESWSFGYPNISLIVGVENLREDHDDINQWTIASIAGHPFMAVVIQRITKAIHEAPMELLKDVKWGVIDITGPGIFKEVVWDYLRSRGMNLDLIASNYEDIQVHGMFVFGNKNQLFNDPNPDGFLIMGKAFMNPTPHVLEHHYSGFNEKNGWKNKKAEFH